MPNKHPDDRLLWLRWLTRLRWVALVAQVITLGFAYPLIQPWTALLVMCAVMIVLLMANLRALAVLSLGLRVHEGTLLWQLTVDVVALTTFFVLAGGPENPFVVLYLVHVAMGAFMLKPPQAAALCLLVLGSYLSLHVWNLPLQFDNHSLSAPELHELGQMVAFMVTVPSVAIFMVGMATALRQRTASLLEARDRTSRIDRLRSVGTLAAGAAHELNTPLSTIDLRTRRLQRRHHDDDSNTDLEVIRTQLARCTRIVQQLLAGAGDPSAAGMERAPLADLVRESVTMWIRGNSLEVAITDDSNGALVELPRVAFSQALTNLLENAREAQASTANHTPLQILLTANDTDATLHLRDHGCGLPNEPEQVGTPFFTTKPAGTGLGVFVARQVADGAGGGLRYQTHRDGTTAHWWFPIDKPETRRPSAPENP